jgi:hypothetical protein
VFGGGPCGLDGLVGEEGPVEDSGEVVLWSAGMVAEILEDTQVVVKVSHGHDVIDHVA